MPVHLGVDIQNVCMLLAGLLLAGLVPIQSLH